MSNNLKVSLTAFLVLAAILSIIPFSPALANCGQEEVCRPSDCHYEIIDCVTYVGCGNEVCQYEWVCEGERCEWVDIPCGQPQPTQTPFQPTTPPSYPTATPRPKPTNTPIPTATPTPTSTPVPTATLIPTATPTPREPPATCACWLLSAEGNSDLADVKKGDTLNFIAEAYVSTPETAEVIDMAFVLEHEDEEIGHSGTVPAQFNRSEVIGGVNTDVYRSTWSYRVPSTGDVEGLYYLKLIIHCGWKEGEGQGIPLASRTSQTLKVLGETETKSGFASLIERILSLFGLRKQEVVIRPEGKKTLQLGTFKPVPTLPAGGCTDLYFQVRE